MIERDGYGPQPFSLDPVPGQWFARIAEPVPGSGWMQVAYTTGTLGNMIGGMPIWISDTKECRARMDRLAEWSMIFNKLMGWD